MSISLSYIVSVLADRCGLPGAWSVGSLKTVMLTQSLSDALSKAPLPFVLVACKCDKHTSERQVDPTVVEQKAKSFLGEVHAFQTADQAPDTQKRCLAVILRSAIAARRRK